MDNFCPSTQHVLINICHEPNNGKGPLSQALLEAGILNIQDLLLLTRTDISELVYFQDGTEHKLKMLQRCRLAKLVEWPNSKPSRTRINWASLTKDHLIYNKDPPPSLAPVSSSTATPVAISQPEPKQSVSTSTALTDDANWQPFKQQLFAAASKYDIGAVFDATYITSNKPAQHLSRDKLNIAWNVLENRLQTPKARAILCQHQATKNSQALFLSLVNEYEKPTQPSDSTLETHRSIIQVPIHNPDTSGTLNPITPVVSNHSSKEHALTPSATPASHPSSSTSYLHDGKLNKANTCTTYRANLATHFPLSDTLVNPCLHAVLATDAMIQLASKAIPPDKDKALTLPGPTAYSKPVSNNFITQPPLTHPKLSDKGSFDPPNPNPTTSTAIIPLASSFIGGESSDGSNPKPYLLPYLPPSHLGPMTVTACSSFSLQIMGRQTFALIDPTHSTHLQAYHPFFDFEFNSEVRFFQLTGRPPDFPFYILPLIASIFFFALLMGSVQLSNNNKVSKKGSDKSGDQADRIAHRSLARNLRKAIRLQALLAPTGRFLYT